MRKSLLYAALVAGGLFLATVALAQPTDLGEITLRLTPTTTGEFEFDYKLQVTDMGNGHYALTGRASRAITTTATKADPGIVIPDPTFPPVEVICAYHTKVVNGNAEIVDSDVVIHLEETYGVAPTCATSPILLTDELYRATVRVVLPVSDLTSGSFKAIVHAFDREALLGSPWASSTGYPKVVEGSAGLR